MNSTTVKSFLYNFIISSMIFFVTTKVITGIEMTGKLLYWTIIYVIFTVANLMVKHLLRFLTLPANFFTYWLAASILSFAAIYGMSLVLPGIRLETTILDSISTGIISINAYTLTPFLTAVLGSVFAGLLSAALYTLAE